MGTILDKIKHWEKDADGDIVFKGTEDAILYATLIYNLSDRINEIKQLRKKFIVKIGAYKILPEIDYDWLMILACKGQFYRECLEEIQRLRDSRYLLGDLN